jgi:hypothetical protein
MSDLNFLEGVSETKRRFLSDKRPSHVFCELKTPDTIQNCETLVNEVPPDDNDSLVAIAIGARRVRKTPEKIHFQRRTRLKTPDTLTNGNPINAVRVPSWSEFDQAEQECRKESD